MKDSFGLINSKSADSDLKVVKIMDVFKKGMTVKTSARAKRHEKINLQLEYHGQQFNVDAVVVKARKNNTADIKFVNTKKIDPSFFIYMNWIKRK
jgi:hypothetical protein